MTTCAVCGFVFDPGSAQAACGRCPLSRGCALVCCPNCGTSTVPEAADRPAAPPGSAPATTLDRLEADREATISDLDPGLSRSDAVALAGLGVLPGAPVTVLRRSPACLVRIGVRTVALDRELARRIRLRPPPPLPARPDPLPAAPVR